MPKNDAQKLTLENFIFLRAAQLEVPVSGIQGQLFCPCWEPYLQVSIYLYNACFAAPCQEDKPVCNPWPYGGVKNGWIIC